MTQEEQRLLRDMQKKIILAPFIKNPFSQSSHISSAEIVWQLVDNCRYFLNRQTLNIFSCWVVCQTKQDIWKYLGLRETAWKLWSTLKCMEVGDSTEYTTENWVFCQRSYEVNLVSYSPSSNSSHTSANTVICCLWKVKSKNSDTNSTAVWLTLTPANQSVIQAVSQSVNVRPTIQHASKQTQKHPAVQNQPVAAGFVELSRSPDATHSMTAHYSKVQSRVKLTIYTTVLNSYCHSSSPIKCVQAKETLLLFVICHCEGAVKHSFPHLRICSTRQVTRQKPTETH